MEIVNNSIFIIFLGVTTKLRKTVRIDLFIGLRRSRDRRMGVSRVRSGNTPRDTLETGKTIRKMVSVFSSITMETNTRVSGSMISAMVKALTGEMKKASCVVSTQVTGTKTRSTAEALSSIKMETVTMGIGLLACLREKAA